MQVSLQWRARRRLKRYLIVGIASALFAWAFANAQDWRNDMPWWVYEDSTPAIPADVRLKIHNINQAWSLAYEYHNTKFRPVYDQREGQNLTFALQWNFSFRPYWVTLSETLYGYISSKLQFEARITVPGKVVDFEHSRLAGKTRMVAAALVEKARVLTLYLEDDTVRTRWEIFTRRLITLEEAIKELE